MIPKKHKKHIKIILRASSFVANSKIPDDYEKLFTKGDEIVLRGYEALAYLEKRKLKLN